LGDKVAVFRHEVRRYASQNSMIADEIIELIKSGYIDGIEEGGEWFVRIDEKKEQEALLKLKIKASKKLNKQRAEKNNEIIQYAKDTGDWESVSEQIILQEIQNIILTTSFSISGKEIEKEIEIITAECVYGMNIFKDFLNAVRDISGGRSGTVQSVLRDARKTVLSELKKEALFIGADAVISIDLDYQELSGGNKSGMLMLVASGTAVKLK